jgi:two-component system cell cycle sensor histidine kinase/response regulator CckA
VRAQLIVLALVIALPLLIGSAIRIYSRSKDGRAQVEREVSRTTRLISGRVDERVRSAESMLIGLTHAVRIDTTQRAFNDALFRSTLKSAPQRYANIFAFDARGARLGASLISPRLDSVHVSTREYFAPLIAHGGFRTGAARRSSILNDSALIVPFVRSIADSAGKSIAIIGATLRIDSLTDLIKVDEPLPPKSVVTIVDTSGMLIASSLREPKDRDSAAVRRNRVAARSMKDDDVQVVVGRDSVRRIFGYAHAQSAPWIVSIGIPEDVALAPMYGEMKRDLVAGTISLAIGIALALMLGGRIADPLDALSDDARAIAAGDVGRRTRVKSRSEVGVLADAFNQMADNVERRNAALAEGERRYRLMFDSNPLPMYAWDADSLFILASNEAAQERYGYTKAAFLTKRMTDLLDPKELLRFERVRASFSDRPLAPVSWSHRTATGEQVEMEVVSAPSGSLGPPSWLSVSIDVTARNAAERALARSEEQLRQSQKMEAVGAFAGGIAHDFNNLLTGMLGYCELLMETVPVGGDTWNDIAEIKALAMRGAELTRQILTVSRKQIVQHTALDVNAVVISVDRLLRRLIGEHISLATELAPDVGCIRADAGQLEQVLLNLASNARDSMRPGGALTIRTAVLRARNAPEHDLPEQDWVSITVSDTGAGMTEEVRQRVFEPFFTTKDRGKGTGLGLALVYATMEQSAGVVRVISAPGKGATFTLYFPRSNDDATLANVQLTPEPAVHGTELILLAEDEDSVRAVAKESLERRGYRVLAAADGPAALRVAREFSGAIDLLLTDVVMPGMNGRELAELLLQERPGTRVLFASGYTDDAVLLHGVRTDELSFMQKPFTPLTLAQRVREVLDSPIRTN